MIFIELNGKEFKVPQSRSEVTYSQWKEAYKHIHLADEAREAYEAGNDEKATILVIEHLASIISALSIGVTKDDLLQVKYEQLVNLHILHFKWISDEEPKTKFIIKGKKFDVPDFGKMSALQLMDCMALIQQMKEDDEIDKGVVIASIYCREQYVQDFEDLEAKQRWLKDNANLDLFYSCAFFLRSGLAHLPSYTLHHSLAEAVEMLTSTLNDWVSILYLQVLQKQPYSVIQWSTEQFSTKPSRNQWRSYFSLLNIRLQSKKIILYIKNKLLYLRK
jgi:hypothetical protein